MKRLIALAAALAAALAGSVAIHHEAGADLTACTGYVVVAEYGAGVTCDLQYWQRLDFYLPYGMTVADGVALSEQLGGHIRLVTIDVDF